MTQAVLVEIFKKVCVFVYQNKSYKSLPTGFFFGGLTVTLLIEINPDKSLVLVIFFGHGDATLSRPTYKDESELLMNINKLYHTSLIII